MRAPKQRERKLPLRAETLRQLDAEQARAIDGGECTVTEVIRTICTLTLVC